MGSRSPNPARQVLVVALALVFAFTLGAAFAVAVWANDPARTGVKDVLGLLLTAEAVALAVAAAWYFAMK